MIFYSNLCSQNFGKFCFSKVKKFYIIKINNVILIVPENYTFLKI